MLYILYLGRLRVYKAIFIAKIFILDLKSLNTRLTYSNN